MTGRDQQKAYGRQLVSSDAQMGRLPHNQSGRTLLYVE
jgi:hypothetical protein